ncbi:hypothetical protein LSPH24S_01267 [Lysinibacillus sphaericus]
MKVVKPVTLTALTAVNKLSKKDTSTPARWTPGSRNNRKEIAIANETRRHMLLFVYSMIFSKAPHPFLPLMMPNLIDISIEKIGEKRKGL